MRFQSGPRRPAPDGQLHRILGVSFGIAVTIGGMIGLGILRTPGTVASQLGSVWLIGSAWVLGGAYAILGVLQAAELGTSVPKTGGPYVFAKRALGPFPGFAVGWMDWISYPAGIALTSITIGEYLALLVPGLSSYVKTTAVGVLLFLGALNWFGLRVGSRLQEVTSFLKALVFLGLIAACFLMGGSQQPDDPASAASTRLPLGFTAIVGALILALQGVIFAYDGWYAAVYFSEENEDPSRSLPRSMIGGVLAVMGIYLLFNFALIYVLPLDRLAASSLPAADAANTIFGTFGDQAVTALALISLLSIMNSTLMMAPRILFAMGRDGLFFSKAAAVNDGGTPVIGLAITLASALPLVLIGTFEKLLAVSAFLYIGIYLSAFISVLVLRAKEPELPRPFKAWGYPWSTLIVLAGSLAFLVGAIVNDTENSVYAVLVIAASYPLYVFFKRRGGQFE